MPPPCPWLDCWTSYKQLPSSSGGKWRKGNLAASKEKGRPVLCHADVYTGPLIRERYEPLSSFRRPQLKICWILLQVLVPNSCPEEPCVRPPVLCQPCVGTSWFVNPRSRSKAWLQGSCQPPQPQHKARLPLPGGCDEHVAELGEHTHRDKYPCVAKDCVKGVNWLF